MGNWRTVTITGSIAPEHAVAASEFINIGQDFTRFHPLCNYGPSMFGLGAWMPEDGGAISAVGNLSERDYSVQSVADVLEKLVAIVPSLELKVHCGGDYEDTACIATVTVHDGQVAIGDPEAETVGVGLQELGMARLAAMTGLPPRF